MNKLTAALLSTALYFGLDAHVLAADEATADKQAADKTSANKPASVPGAPKHDTHLPIEISSDNLEVLQKENKAIFRGNVIAVQGTLRLNSDKMTVHYKQKSATAAPGAPAPAPTPAPTPAPATTAAGGTPPSEMGAITHIEVEGHVLVVTPEETAEGDRGDYDAESRFLKLTGDNVVLTRDQNILRGKAVDYNLDTGRSVMTGGDSSQQTKGSDHRVRGVFIPKSTPKDAKSAPKATPLPTPQPTMMPQTDSSR